MTASVVVTGGAGYIGSHACKALARAGLLPVAFDDLSRGHRWAVRWGPLEVGSVTDEARLDAVFAAYRPIAVLHLAAASSDCCSTKDPAHYYTSNVGGLLSLLAAMRRARVARIVFSSTAAVYGDPVRLPVAESHPLQPINPYGASKLAAERILHDFAAAYGIRSISLRFFNAAGADAEGEIGEAHEPETHLIPSVLAAAAGLRRDVTIYGHGYETRDGTCVRDYIHVADLAEAHVLALRRIETGEGAHAFNLGNGQGFSVQEIIDTARRVTGDPIAVRIQSARPFDPPMLVADARRARAHLGWQPKAALDGQLRDAWRWLTGRYSMLVVRPAPPSGGLRQIPM